MASFAAEHVLRRGDDLRFATPCCGPATRVVGCSWWRSQSAPLTLSESGPMVFRPTGATFVRCCGGVLLLARSMFGPACLLSLSATNLLDGDIMSKSDPMVVVYLKKGDGKLEELGRTEVILNSLNPAWIEKITVSYQFEFVQPLIFHIYDVDTKYHDANVKTLSLKDQDFLGEGSCVLSEVVTKQSRSLTLNLHNKNGHGGLRNLGTLTVHAEETMASKSVVEIKFRCSHLENKALFYKSDPFLRISRIVESGGSVPICKTGVVYNNLNPTWKPLSLSMQQFGSKDNPLIIECFDCKTNGNHVLIGKLVKSVADLERLYKEKSGVNFIIPSSRLGHEKVSNNGQLFVDQFCEKEQFSLKSCQVNS